MHVILSYWKHAGLVSVLSYALFGSRKIPWGFRKCRRGLVLAMFPYRSLNSKKYKLGISHTSRQGQLKCFSILWIFSLSMGEGRRQNSSSLGCKEATCRAILGWLWMNHFRYLKVRLLWLATPCPSPWLEKQDKLCKNTNMVCFRPGIHILYC